MFRDNDATINVDNWLEVQKYPIQRFSDFINLFEYKSDLFGGLFDMSFSRNEPNYFFNKSIKYGRDCDDWARIWHLYLSINNFSLLSEIGPVLTSNIVFTPKNLATVTKKRNSTVRKIIY
jgi:hypothetical protein